MMDNVHNISERKISRQEHFLLNEEVSFWIMTATQGICRSDKERIQKEIGEHYSETIQENLDAGMTYLQAQKAALFALGNPKKARKYFRRMFITEKEAKSLVRFMSRNRVYCFPIGFFLIFMALSALLLSSGIIHHRMTPHSIGMIALIWTGFLVLFIQEKLVPHLLRQGKSFRAVAWEALGPFAIMIMQPFNPVFDFLPKEIKLIFLLFIVLSPFYYMPLLLKIKRLGLNVQLPGNTPHVS